MPSKFQVAGIFAAIAVLICSPSSTVCAKSNQSSYGAQITEKQQFIDAESEEDSVDPLELRVDEPNLLGRLLRLAIMESEGPVAAINLIKQYEAHQNV